MPQGGPRPPPIPRDTVIDTGNFPPFLRFLYTFFFSQIAADRDIAFRKAINMAPRYRGGRPTLSQGLDREVSFFFWREFGNE